ncbi:hypothetical protein N8K70_10880 [Microbacterium betulae]|uniref:Asp23/Gls24 family envelope stress response protein n=1 Tax=Microbacterium betulae TaxID=2981139 RepID=A0AA97FFV7_9MICO|nr:hypothetical protein [Microbacterium sp. AB]WOF21888.1 hypothetical protein N8K70_10880 [Microbacterium sp. AB]
MSVQRRTEIARAVQGALESTPGVTGLFRTGPLIARVVDAGAELLGWRDAERPFVDLKDADGELRAIASIGVDVAAPAAATCRLAAENASGALAALGAGDVTIELTIVLINEP